MNGPGGTSSCLTVFGLAYDATEREVHVLFSGCSGFVRCIVVPGKGSQKPYSFVQFSTQQEAAYAMESRQGTTWEPDTPPIAIEPAKRDIPQTFVPRQGVDIARTPLSVVAPPPKRSRPEVIGKGGSWQQDVVIGKGGTWQQSAKGKGGAGLQEMPAADAGPRTLHVGGLPPNLTQQDLDFFLESTFGPACIGGKLNESGGGGMACRAFVGFVSNQDATDALAMLEGFTWEGMVLRAEWARSEFRMPGSGQGQGAGAGAPPPAAAQPPWPQSYAPPAPQLLMPRVPVHGGGGKGKGDASWAPVPGGGGKGKGDASWAPARRTLHFTSLPPVDEQTFEQFLQMTFPDQVVCANFKDTKDGRPPVAWVLFAEEGVAGSVASTHQMFEWEGSQVQVQFARTELDPAKFHK